MIFPIKGSTGSAVVSVYATKEAGKYVIRQLGIQTVFGIASRFSPSPASVSCIAHTWQLMTYTLPGIPAYLLQAGS